MMSWHGKARADWFAIASCILFYLAAVNAVLARVAGTCTMGDADRLWGAALSLLVYLLAASVFGLARHPRAVLLACAPVLGVMAWQLVFALRFSFGTLVAGKSACEMLEGRPFVASGSEASYTLIWLMMAATAPLATGVGFIAARRRSARSRPSRSANMLRP